MPAPIRLMVFEGYQPGYGFFNAFGALTRPLLKRGSTGLAVAEAQGLLEQKLNRSIASPRGTFDTNTEAAVLEFQRMYGGVLAVDGTIGKNTWTALLGQEVTIGATPLPETPPSLPPGSTPPGVPPPIDITVGGKEEQSNMGLYAGLGLAALAAVFLLRRK